MGKKGFESSSQVSPAAALRHGIFNKLTPILLSSDFINDSAMRDMIKENCGAVVSLLEGIIKQYNLDQKISSPD